MSRKQDENVEAQVGEFMDRHLWDRTRYDYVRVKDRRLQCLGCDLSAGGYLIDEKVKYWNCLNRMLEYPSFEILTDDRNGNRMEGWFVNPKNVTNYYMFISIGTDETDYSRIAYDTIRDLSVLMVSKKSVYGFLSDTGCPVASVERDAVELSQDDFVMDEKPRRRYGHGQYHLTYSKNLRERPVNLVVPKQTLLRLENVEQFVVSRDGVSRL